MEITRSDVPNNTADTGGTGDYPITCGDAEPMLTAKNLVNHTNRVPASSNRTGGAPELATFVVRIAELNIEIEGHVRGPRSSERVSQSKTSLLKLDL